MKSFRTENHRDETEFRLPVSLFRPLPKWDANPKFDIKFFEIDALGSTAKPN